MSGELCCLIGAVEIGWTRAQYTASGVGVILWIKRLESEMVMRALIVKVLGLFAALLVMAIISLLTAFVFVWVSTYLYNMNHPIHDPVARGDDLGLGLIAVLFFAIGFLLPLPLLPFLARYFTDRPMNIIQGGTKDV